MVAPFLNMVQHLRHSRFEGMKAFLLFFCIFALFNDSSLLPNKILEIKNYHYFRITMSVFLYSCLLGLFMKKKLAILYTLGLGSVFLGVFLPSSLSPHFKESFLEPRWALLVYLIYLVVFVFWHRREFLLHRRYLICAFIANIVAIGFSLGGLGVLSAGLDLVTILFMIYFLNLFFTRASFLNHMELNK